MSAVWDADLPPMEKLVLLALADCANDEGGCWPAVSTIMKKSGQGERTVRRAIQSLIDKRHLSQKQRTGTSPMYRVHPCQAGTPAAQAPLPDRQDTPATQAPKPSGTVNTKANAFVGAKPVILSANWWPEEYGPETQTRQIIDGWPPGEMPVQVEQFIAHHTSRGTKIKNLQAAFATWVINSRKFGARRHERPFQPANRSAHAYQLLTEKLRADEPF